MRLALLFAVILAATDGHAEDPPDYLLEWGGNGSEPGKFDGPADVAFDISNNVYVVDNPNHRVQLFDATGALLDVWGSESSDQFRFPRGIAVDPVGCVYVADWGNGRVLKLSSSGNFIRSMSFDQPMSVDTDMEGNLYVADQETLLITKVDSVGNVVTAWGGEGAEPGLFIGTVRVAVGPSGFVFVTSNYRAQKFTSNGEFVLEWGSRGTDADEFEAPRILDLDADGNVYISDWGNHRIQKFTGEGVFLSE